ncbi:general stress protein [Piscibacillus halophilus]|uniref:Heat induced stress protein YflT n=1 Tax=Piscibacillus halophilus TaxID=571933 RepID=A0A1H9IUI3_9BACI|nr:general stress protein [Piscibacillus halophilus]SEQ78177.1 Heat induced stress protein YflT [Piscibacillus halophilus]
MTFIKDYKNDQNLEHDIQKLLKNGVSQDDIYVLAHDDNHTQELAHRTRANTLQLAQDEGFDQKGDELRSKLEEAGVTEEGAEQYEAMLDQGKILLIVRGERDLDDLLQ